MLNKLKNINRNQFKKGIVLADQMMVSGSNFLLGVLLVRSLGLESYGIYALLWLVVLFALGINQALITKPMLSLAPKMNEKDSDAYLSSIHALQLALSGAFCLLGLVIYWSGCSFGFSDEYRAFIPILSVLIFFHLYHDFFRKSCFIKDKIGLAFSIDAILYLGQLVLLAVLWLQNQLNLNFVLISILATSLLAVIVAALFIGISLIPTTSTFPIWKRQFDYAKWLVGTALLQWFSGNYFIIIGATIIGAIAVGALRMVQNIMGVFHVMFLFMENTVPIETSRVFRDGGWSAMSQYLKKNTISLGIFFLLLMITVSVLSSWIITLLYGASYLKYSYIVVVYCGLYVLVFASLPFQFALRTIELTYPMFVAYVLATLFSFFAAHFFLQQWEMPGLLAGLILTQLITLLTYAFYCRRYALSQNKIKTVSLKKVEV